MVLGSMWITWREYTQYNLLSVFSGPSPSIQSRCRGSVSAHGVSRGHGWDMMATWGCQVKLGERTVGPKGSWTHIHPLVAWLCLPCGRCLPDRLDSVPPAIAEGAIHHDGSHTTAQVVAKGIREDQGKNQWNTDIQEAANSWRLSLQKLTQSAISLTPSKKAATKASHFPGSHMSEWVFQFSVVGG